MFVKAEVADGIGGRPKRTIGTAGIKPDPQRIGTRALQGELS